MKSEREEIEEDTKMIQDIAPHIYHNEYKPVQPEEDSFLLYFEEKGRLRTGTERSFHFPDSGIIRKWSGSFPGL